jgi:hypothetical protein
MIFAIDFDGTCVKHRFPEVGEDCPYAIEVLNSLVENGHKLVLNTMRDGDYLEAAVEWFKQREIPLYGVNRNPEQSWTTSPKILADVYIDDAALGCPMTFDADLPEDYYADWKAIYEILKINQIL